ncbi:hypothetical protein [Nocardioides litoris]|uniref:hypothetical protein n=1 Tax=Nocardioides litoris TaxID=1926648 RepID=UPI00111F4B7F|nr:hypothetical protein [Nocardioides litoris]
MGTLYKDMSRLAPAPTLRRETASLVANSIVVVAFFAVLIVAFDAPPAVNGAVGGALLAALVTRWAYVALTARQQA